jgi:hypothetical protein
VIADKTGMEGRGRPLAVLTVALFVAATAAAGAAALPPGGTFRDDDGNPHEPNIEAIVAAGITAGCNSSPPLYCPSQPVTRGQMATFIRRAFSLPPAGRDYFSDDNGSAFEDSINRLAAAGITSGCGPGRYCPDAPVTREQMAAFLRKAANLPPAGRDYFSDDNGSAFEDSINRLAAAGITSGCGPGRFCPRDPVLRDQMATFLTRALHLTPIVPPPGCPILPADNIWNTRVDTLPVHPRSAQYVASIGGTAYVHADFGSGVWPPGSTSPIGIPFVEVPAGQPTVPIVYTAYGNESDPGPFPIPPDAPIEGGPSAGGDRHVIVLDRSACRLYELFSAFPQSNGSWRAASGAAYDLRSNNLRPAGWTSADAAGLPIFPGLVRWEEVASGKISHAIRFTAPNTQRAYVWPARHFASNSTNLNLPPMGQRFRLKAGFDISGFSPEVRVILTAMKQYGIILADNGSPWYISGAPDARWNNSVLHQLHQVPGSAFEAVIVDSLQVNPNSGQAAG